MKILLLIFLSILLEPTPQDQDTVFWHKLNNDTVIKMTFNKHCIDSIVTDYKNPDGYCPPKKIEYYRIEKDYSIKKNQQP